MTAYDTAETGDADTAWGQSPVMDAHASPEQALKPVL